MVRFCEKKYPLYSRDENIFPQPVDKIAENAPIYNREANQAGACSGEQSATSPSAKAGSRPARRPAHMDIFSGEGFGARLR